MPRLPRKKSESGIYHIMLRGIDYQTIFYEDTDNIRFIHTLQRAKQLSETVIYGYCLMGNHVHLLVKEGKEEISAFMKRIGTGYARWYNWKYERSGHLFQNRYGSEPVENDRYLLTVIRYIHNNPVKANLVNKPEQWNWSSCKAYYNENRPPDELIETSFILSMFSNKKNTAIDLFRKFMEEENSDQCLDYEKPKKKSDLEVMEEVMKLTDNQGIQALKGLPKKERDTLLRALKQQEGITCRQIARVLGLSTSLVLKA